MRANSKSLYFLLACSLLVFVGTLWLAGFFSPAPPPTQAPWKSPPPLGSIDSTQPPAQAPEQLRQFVDSEILQAIDVAANQPRVIAGDRFDTVSPALRIQAKLMAQSAIQQVRPNVTVILVVDSSGRTIEELRP